MIAKEYKVGLLEEDKLPLTEWVRKAGIEKLKNLNNKNFVTLLEIIYDCGFQEAVKRHKKKLEEEYDCGYKDGYEDGVVDAENGTA